MPLSLHAAFVPSALQMLGVGMDLVDKAEGWCVEHDKDPSELIKAVLIEDMLPFDYQIKSIAVHTAQAIEGVRAGQFAPDLTPAPDSFAGMREKLSGAIEQLEQINPNEMEELIGQPVDFVFKGKPIYSFTAENFLLSFSQPNFYFHAVTAYDLLRMKGVPLGKRDYLGAMRSI